MFAIVCTCFSLFSLLFSLLFIILSMMLAWLFVVLSIVLAFLFRGGVYGFGLSFPVLSIVWLVLPCLVCSFSLGFHGVVYGFSFVLSLGVSLLSIGIAWLSVVLSFSIVLFCCSLCLLRCWLAFSLFCLLCWFGCSVMSVVSACFFIVLPAGSMVETMQNKAKAPLTKQ